MSAWASMLMEVLWRNALAVIPLTLLVAAICRWLPSRPATRHALWLGLLLLLLAPPSGTGGVISRFADGWLEPAPHVGNEETTGREMTVPLLAWVSEDRETRAETDGDGLALRRAPVVSPNGEQPPVAPSAPASQPIHGESPGLDGLVFAPEATVPQSVAPLRRLNEATHRPEKRPRDTRATRPTGSSPSHSVAAIASRGDVGLAGPVQTAAPLRIVERRASNAPPESRLEAFPNSGSSAGVPRDVPDEAPPFAVGPARAAEGVEPSLAAQRSDTVRPIERGLTGARSVLAAWADGLLTARELLLRLPSLPASVWITGSALVLLGGVWRTMRLTLRVQAGYAAPRSVERLVAEVARASGVRRVPRTRMVADRLSPMVLCGRRPTLVLPEVLWAMLDDVGRRTVILHELAHLRRRDHWVCGIELLVGCLYWWHPLVWWIRNRIHAEAEDCCDAWVTWLFPRGRAAYARALLTTKSFVSQSAISTPANGIGVMTPPARRLARRLRMVMTQSTAPRLSVAGLMVALALSAVGWLANPAWACPKKSTPPAAAAAECTTPQPSAPAGKASQSVTVTSGSTPTAPSDLFVSPKGSVSTTAAPGENGKDTFARHLARSRNSNSGSRVSATTAVVEDDAYEDESLDDQLDRLDQQMDDLHEQILRLKELVTSEQDDREAAADELLAVEMAGSLYAAALGRSAEGLTTVRVYALPDEAPAVLADVLVQLPVVATPVEGGIEVEATVAEHAVVAAFVDLVAGDQQTHTYCLSPGKLEHLGAVLADDDVTVHAVIEGDCVVLQGSLRDHGAFEAFVRLIDPTGPASTRGTACEATNALFAAEFPPVSAANARVARIASAELQDLASPSDFAPQPGTSSPRQNVVLMSARIRALREALVALGDGPEERGEPAAVEGTSTQHGNELSTSPKP